MGDFKTTISWTELHPQLYLTVLRTYLDKDHIQHVQSGDIFGKRLAVTSGGHTIALQVGERRFVTTLALILGSLRVSVWRGEVKP